MTAEPLPVVVDPRQVGGHVVGGVSLAVRAAQLLGAVASSAPALAVTPAAGPVVVLDAAHALAPATLLDAVLDLAGRRPDAVVVAAREVTDTLKAVDGAGRVLTTVDRAGRREVLTPLVLPSGLPDDLAALVGDGVSWLPPLLQAAAAHGIAVLTAPAPPDLVVVTDGEDLALIGA